MLVVAGETIVDFIEQSPKQFTPFLGGGPYNVARAAAKLGAETGYFCPISNDDFGQDYEKEMKILGIKMLLPRSSAPSGLAIVKKNAEGVPSYSFYREHSADRDITKELIENNMPDAECFYIGGLALTDGEDAEIWTDFMKNVTSQVFVDPNIRPSFIKNRDIYLERLTKIYSFTDILKLSDEDIEWIEPNKDPETYLREVMERYKIPFAFLTLGSKGAKLLTSTFDVFIHVPKIIVEDTVGAGDCFSAAILSQWIKAGVNTQLTEKIAHDILSYAVMAAAINCERAGANPPTHQEILDRL